MKTTVLHQNPFYVLGVNTRDGRQRIIERADEVSLVHDSDQCQKARSDLTNPRTRLTCEMGWLPAVSPRRATSLVEALLSNPKSVRSEQGLPTLAHVNLLASAFEAIDAHETSANVAEFIQEIASLVEALSIEEILRSINEDRTIAGFPEIRGPELVEAELVERKRYYRNAIKDALNRLAPSSLIEAMTMAVDEITQGGKVHAPGLIDDLVDSYEVETQGFLQKEAENADKLVKAIEASGPKGSDSIDGLIKKLELVVRNWGKVARPIQLSSMARGIDHAASKELAYSIRNLALELFNTHGLLKQSQSVTKLLQDSFSLLPEVAERVNKDANDLQDIKQKRDESALLDPLRKYCEDASNSADRNPQLAHHEGQRLVDESKGMLGRIPVKANSPTLLEARDMVAATIMTCAIAYGNKTSKWQPCISLLESALETVNDNKLRQKIRENLATVQANHRSFGDLEPIDSAPSLSSVNGIGFTMYGSTDHDRASGSYLSTYYFIFFAIPVFPIARYRVIPTAGGYRFLGKSVLRPMDKWHIAISIGLLAYMFLH